MFSILFFLKLASPMKISLLIESPRRKLLYKFSEGLDFNFCLVMIIFVVSFLTQEGFVSGFERLPILSPQMLSIVYVGLIPKYHLIVVYFLIELFVLFYYLMYGFIYYIFIITSIGFEFLCKLCIVSLFINSRNSILFPKLV